MYIYHYHYYYATKDFLHIYIHEPRQSIEWPQDGKNLKQFWKLERHNFKILQLS